MGRLKIEQVMDGHNSALGPSYIVTDGWEPVCCFGVAKAWPGVAEIWMDRTDWAERNPKRFHRAALMVIREVVGQLGLKRLQATVPERYGQGCRWLERMGFVEEGRMDRFGPDGSAYIRFALFPEEARWVRQSCRS